MIITDDVIVLHFPKTGGSSLRSVLGKHSTPVKNRQDPRIANGPIHDSLATRMMREPDFSVNGRRIICGFRRLPFWLLSSLHFRQKYPHYVPVSREEFLRGIFRYDNDGNPRNADWRLNFFEPEKVDHWIRIEHADEDITTAFAGTTHAKELVSGLPEKNVTPVAYIKHLPFWFSASELEALYQHNPDWAALETRLYGDVLKL